MRLLSRNKIKEAANILNEGGILAVPTETVYGLAVKIDNIPAINKLLDLKDRGIESGKVLTLMVPTVKDIENYARLDRRSRNLAVRYFPGELTMILPKSRLFKHPYFDHFRNIGIRIPDHDYMLKLLEETGPLLVTSANLRGEAPCLSAQEVSQRLPEVDASVRGGCGRSLPSTILDLTEMHPRTIRQGGLLIVHY